MKYIFSIATLFISLASHAIYDPVNVRPSLGGEMQITQALGAFSEVKTLDVKLGQIDGKKEIHFLVKIGNEETLDIVASDIKFNRCGGREISGSWSQPHAYDVPVYTVKLVEQRRIGTRCYREGADSDKEATIKWTGSIKMMNPWVPAQVNEISFEGYPEGIITPMSAINF